MAPHKKLMPGLVALAVMALPSFASAALAQAETPSAPTPAQAQAEPAAQPAGEPAPTEALVPPQPAFTRDTPVADIAANPAGKAVLDHDIPGLLNDPAYPFFKRMSLKQMQEMSGGELSAETVDKAETDLKALAAAR